ncbi:hypothetical protein BGZ60DRAFT_532810 [Tricladium varicosporioides]|nr:hypothetical protein BGZ60DRAFT_532810 [Hymenoscyphus varicosporioides]
MEMFAGNIGRLFRGILIPKPSLNPKLSALDHLSAPIDLPAAVAYSEDVKETVHAYPHLEEPIASELFPEADSASLIVTSSTNRISNTPLPFWMSALLRNPLPRSIVLLSVISSTDEDVARCSNDPPSYSLSKEPSTDALNASHRSSVDPLSGPSTIRTPIGHFQFLTRELNSLVTSSSISAINFGGIALAVEEEEFVIS